MPFVSTMILRSLRLTGEKTRGDTLTANEQTECVAEMQAMWDSWGLQRGLIQSLTQTSFALTASQGTYTIGNGANFNMTRPIRIVDPCFVRDSDDFDSPLTIIDERSYGRLGLKTTDGTYPEYLMYDGAYSATSTATLRLYPEPLSGLTLFINTLQPLEAISSVSQNLIIPPGYQLAIEANYAIHAAGGFTNVSPEVAKMARESLAAIKSANLPAPISRLDYGAVGYPKGSILTGP